MCEIFLFVKIIVNGVEIKPGFHVIRTGLRLSEAVFVGLIADDRKHTRQMFPFKSEVIADNRTTV